MTGKRTEYAEPLLIEWFARRLRFDRLAAAVPGDLYPPYLLVGVALFIEYGVFDVYNYSVARKSTLVEDPASLGIGVALLTGVVGLNWLNTARQEAVETLCELDYGETDESFQPEQFRQTVPLWSKFCVYFAGLIIVYINLFFIVGFGHVIEIEGVIVATAGNFFMIPIVYFPPIIDVAVLCLGISLSLPRQVAHADPSLFYHSAWRFGGLKSVGKALQRSYFLYVIGFSLYTGLLYLQILFPSISPYPIPNRFIDTLFAGLGVLGALAIGYSVHQIHAFMKRKREQRLDELNAKLRQRIESPVNTYGASTAGLESWETLQTEIEQVRSTRTYPFTPAASFRIGIGVLLPQTLNLFRLFLTTDLLVAVSV